jgi:hemerythrin
MPFAGRHLCLSAVLKEYSIILYGKGAGRETATAPPSQLRGAGTRLGDAPAFSLESPSFAADINGMFKWKNEFSVGIPSIDAQHMKLFAIADELNEAMRTGQAKAALSKILARLVQYTTSHFASEEGMMKLHGYPDFAAHKLVHEALTKQVVDFQGEFEAGNAFISIELLTFLKDWLEKHIQGTDIRYSQLMVQRNVV